MSVLALTHVVIDNVAKIPASERGPLGWNEPTWVAAGAFAAAFAGIATAVMAYHTWQLAARTRKLAEETGILAAETRDLVKASAGQIDQAERHHQEGLMPIVFLNVNCRMEGGVGRSVRVRIRGEIVNVGPGAATNVEVIFKPFIFSGWRTYVGILGPNSRQPFDREWQTETDNHLEWLPYESMAIYQSVFGLTGAVEQGSHSGRADNARVEWWKNPNAESAKQVAVRIGEKFSNVQQI